MQFSDTGSLNSKIFQCMLDLIVASMRRGTTILSFYRQNNPLINRENNRQVN